LQDKIEADLEIELQMMNDSAYKMSSVPKMKLNFSLGTFKLTLKHDDNSGM